MRDWTNLSQQSKDEVKRIDMYDSVKAYMLRYKNNDVMKGICNLFMKKVTSLKESHIVQAQLEEIYNMTEAYYNDPCCNQREGVEAMLYDISSASCMCSTKDYFQEKNFQVLI